MPLFLSGFHSIRPPFESPQQETLDWLAAAHAHAEGNREFESHIAKEFQRVGCKPDRIAKRGHVLSDFQHRDWDQMEIYRLNEAKGGVSLDKRIETFKLHAEKICEMFYEQIDHAPDDLIHVSCTGYASPSAAQKLVVSKGWGEKTTVTHAYHMGCYGSLPALRIAQGFLSDPHKERVDIVHTEICSLHSNPSLHQLDQLVSQSLFADGFIRYGLSRSINEPSLQVHSVREELIPQSAEAMTWDLAHWGFKMTLAKEVVVLIAKHLPPFLSRLAQKSGWTLEELFAKAKFAVHPGGPQILLHVQNRLGLIDAQMEASFHVLKSYGNMSSATLPHIWQSLLNDETIPSDTPIVSLAFGPGLTMSGAILEKKCGGRH